MVSVEEVLYGVVRVAAEIGLMRANVVESILLRLDPGVDDELLEESAAVVERRERFANLEREVRTEREKRQSSPVADKRSTLVE